MTTDPREVKGFQVLDQVGAKALAYDDFRRELLDDPKAVLQREGLEIPDDVQVVVHRNHEQLIHLVLPAAPTRKGRLNVKSVDLVSLIQHHPF